MNITVCFVFGLTKNDVSQVSVEGTNVHSREVIVVDMEREEGMEDEEEEVEEDPITNGLLINHTSQ